MYRFFYVVRTHDSVMIVPVAGCLCRLVQRSPFSLLTNCPLIPTSFQTYVPLKSSTQLVSYLRIKSNRSEITILWNRTVRLIVYDCDGAGSRNYFLECYPSMVGWLDGERDMKLQGMQGKMKCGCCFLSDIIHYGIELVAVAGGSRHEPEKLVSNLQCTRTGQ